MRVILDVVHGPRKGRSFVFDGHDTFIVGRSRLVHCPMPEDSALSRDHFLIEIDPPKCELRDLGSTNGTFVNDEKVDDRRSLGSGDLIAAGQSIFLVKFEEGPPGGSSENGRGVAASGMISCAGCGFLAPPGLGVAGGGLPNNHESITWLCDACRAEVATAFQPIPNFTALRELGRGAMGVVYLAQHQQTGARSRSSSSRPRPPPPARPSSGSSARCRSSAR